MSPTVLAFAALFLIAGSMVLWFRRMKEVRIPANRAPFVAAWLGGAVLAVVALAQGVDWVGGIAAFVAAFAGGLFTLLVAISAQQVAPDALKVGDPLPDFSAPDEHGELFSISSLAGKPVLLKFFRGHW